MADGCGLAGPVAVRDVQDRVQPGAEGYYRVLWGTVRYCGVPEYLYDVASQDPWPFVTSKITVSTDAHQGTTMGSQKARRRGAARGARGGLASDAMRRGRFVYTLHRLHGASPATSAALQ